MDPRNYTYQEPEEKSFEPLPKGEYPFILLEVNAMTTTQKTGHSMLPVKFEFQGPDDHKVHVYENFVFSDAAAWKINQFLKCICGGSIDPGRKVDFESPDFIKWMMKQTGTARLSIERVQGKTKDYDRNKIEAFLYDKPAVKGATVSTPPAKAQPPSAPVEQEEDDIPF
jgi:hypothetical protein